MATWFQPRSGDIFKIPEHPAADSSSSTVQSSRVNALYISINLYLTSLMSSGLTWARPDNRKYLSMGNDTLRRRSAYNYLAACYYNPGVDGLLV